MIRMIKEGDWRKAFDILNSAEQLRKSIHWAVQQEALDARRQIIRGITEQAPGGQQFTPLKAITLLLRRAKGFRGSKALIVTASLRNSITVQSAGTGRWFVGVLRTSQRPDGTAQFNVARVHEMGATITIRVTQKMHNWLMMTLRKAKYGAFARSKHPKFNAGAIFGYQRKYASGSVMRTIVVRIPPRPFIQPVVNRIASNPAACRERLTRRIAHRMKLVLGS